MQELAQFGLVVRVDLLAVGLIMRADLLESGLVNQAYITHVDRPLRVWHHREQRPPQARLHPPRRAHLCVCVCVCDLPSNLQFVTTLTVMPLSLKETKSKTAT